jgi:hypothetical protein
MAAIYYWLTGRFHFTNDPEDAEQVKDPARLLEEIERTGVALGDCDDASTFLRGALGCIGIKSDFVRTGFQDAPLRGMDPPLTHVLAIGVDQYGRKVVLDPVAGQRTVRMIAQSRAPRRGLQRNEGDPMVILSRLNAARRAAATGDPRAILGLSTLVRQARRELAAGLWDGLSPEQWNTALATLAAAESGGDEGLSGGDEGLSGRFLARRRRARAKKWAKRAGMTVVGGSREAQQAAQQAAQAVGTREAGQRAGELTPEQAQVQAQEDATAQQAEAAPASPYKTPLLIGGGVVALAIVGLIAFGGKKKAKKE